MDPVAEVVTAESKRLLEDVDEDNDDQDVESPLKQELPRTTPGPTRTTPGTMSSLSDTSEISQQDAFMQLAAPDGYYAYLGVEKKPIGGSGSSSGGSSSSSSSPSTATLSFVVDEDAVKKSYRKLSRRHHPDKGGDPNTFRLLNRAQRVLLHPKLRAQYDNLGIDLDDDEADHPGGDDSATTTNGGDGSNSKDEGNGISQGIIAELANVTLAAIIQLTIRTALMGTVAVFIVRYRWTVYPAILFLSYIVLQVVGKATIRGGSVYDTGVNVYDAVSPGLIIVGLLCMFMGRTSGAEEEEGGKEWTWLFWFGEVLVMALFTYNSLSTIPWNVLSLAGVFVAAGVLALWFRGKVYNYLTVIVVELIFAVLAAMAFPIMEMLLEAILNEKLKKVGEKIRSHHRQLEDYYADKYDRSRK